MTPFFNPGLIEHPDIPIYIAGVNTGLARLAGECANGFHVHPLHTQRYLGEVILPAIEAGTVQAGRSRLEVAVCVTAFAVCNPVDELFARSQVAFYASTPSYRPVMALHGWEAIAEQLSGHATRDEWGEMSALISDEMLANPGFSFVYYGHEDMPGVLAFRIGTLG